MQFLHAAWLVVGCTIGLAGPAHVVTQARGAARSAATANTDEIVRVTAVVTDRRGQPLAGLRPGDFELLVDGRPQTLDTAELVRPAAATARLFAFLLDEFHTAAADSAVIRETLLRFVDRQLRTDDLALVVKPLDPLTAISPTTDRESIRRSLASFEGRKGDYTPRTSFERDYMAQAPSAVASARAQIVTSALRAIGMALSEKLDNRPAIVLVSDGFARFRSSREVPAGLETAIRLANRADVPVYAFAPALSRPSPGEPHPDDSAFAALAALTTNTGGELTIGAESIEAGLARMTRDLDAHYVLTYRAAHGNDGRFHSLQVGVKREGALVRARTGYVARMPPELRPTAAPVQAAPRVLRRSGLIQSWSGILPTATGRANVTLTWEPAPPRSGTQPRASASTIVVTASAADGTTLFDGPVAPVGAAARPEVPDRAAFDAPIGAVRIDIKILDAKGVVIDTDARDVTVPSPRKEGPTIYPAALLRTRSGREFRQVLDDPHAAPAATRDFRRTDRLLIRVPAIDAAGAPAPVSAVLLNRLRQPMRDLPATEAAPPGAVSEFDLPLAPLAPGEYTIRLTVPGPTATYSEHITFRVRG